MSSTAATPDALIAVLLAVAAFVARNGALPRDGLWHDDAVTAAGAVKGSLSQLLVTGFDHPLFTLALRLWDGLTGYDAVLFAVPALIAGLLGPPALFLVLRRIGYDRSISALLGTALVVSEVHIVYSGRVRTYTADVLVILGFILILPRLSRLTWRWPTAAAWVLAALVLASVSAYALVGAVVAGVVLVLHPRADRRVRLLAFAVQVSASAAFLFALQTTYDEAEQANEWQDIWDAFIDFRLNPIVLGAEIFQHLERVSAVFPGGPVRGDGAVIDLHTGWWSTAFVATALVGLAATAASRRTPLRGRYLILILLFAVGAGILDRLPFGPSGTGARASLWLVPVMAVGLATVLQFARTLAARNPGRRRAFDVAAYASAAVLLATSLGTALPYPHPGSKSAAQFVERGLGERDAAFILPGAMYAFAVETDFSVSMREQPEDGIGFIPEFEDPRLTVLDDHFGVDERSRPLPDLEGVHRVFVYSAWPEPASPATAALYLLGVLLPRRGFQPERTVAFEDARVLIWQR